MLEIDIYQEVIVKMLNLNVFKFHQLFNSNNMNVINNICKLLFVIQQRVQSPG